VEIILAISAFLTDTTLCIGCKACEVACKEYNDVPTDGFTWTGRSYDNTLQLGHSTWRHVAFVEMEPRIGVGGNSGEQITWQFLSDVCKHCEHAGCLEACPTGSIVRTELGTVYVQPDVCNGCGYCVVGCPFGVIDRRPEDGRAFKCTFCYDRQRNGDAPACAKACPTQSILFGDLDDLRQRADARIQTLHARGVHDAVIYDPRDTSVGGIHAMFIVRGDPEAYNLPAKPEVPTIYQRDGWRSAAVAAFLAIAGTAFAFIQSSGQREQSTSGEAREGSAPANRRMRERAGPSGAPRGRKR
jgi:formate dehydrogenase iron-sulfur subunit